MSWKDKDWDFLRFYNNDKATLEAAAKHYFSDKDSEYYQCSEPLKYDGKELVIFRLDKDIYQPNEYDKKLLQFIADKYDVCISYTWLCSYHKFDITPRIEE